MRWRTGTSSTRFSISNKMARLLCLFAFVASASAFSFAPAAGAAVRSPAVSMSVQFTDPFVQAMKKKNPMTGSTKNLKGYTVGSRAPKSAVNSGTKITTSYRLEGNVVKSDGDLIGAPKNSQNVPTTAVILVPVVLYTGLQFFGNLWG